MPAHHTQWTATDGAPTGIEFMTPTRDGFLWLASAGGLFRFDGIEFERFRGVNGVSLLSQHPYTLFATANGGLWIGVACCTIAAFDQAVDEF